MAYGFESNNADGSSLISSTDGVARLIYAQEIAHDFSGSISFPNFDSNLGVFYPRFYPLFISYGGSVTNQIPYFDYNGTSDFTDSFGVDIRIRTLLPTLVWDNSSKIMNITQAVIENGTDLSAKYKLFMVHYK